MRLKVNKQKRMIISLICIISVIISAYYFINRSYYNIIDTNTSEDYKVLSATRRGERYESRISYLEFSDSIFSNFNKEIILLKENVLNDPYNLNSGKNYSSIIFPDIRLSEKLLQVSVDVNVVDLNEIYIVLYTGRLMHPDWQNNQRFTKDYVVKKDTGKFEAINEKLDLLIRGEKHENFLTKLQEYIKNKRPDLQGQLENGGISVFDFLNYAEYGRYEGGIIFIYDRWQIRGQSIILFIDAENVKEYGFESYIY